MERKSFTYTFKDGTVCHFRKLGAVSLTAVMQGLPAFGGPKQDEKYQLTKYTVLDELEFGMKLICAASVEPKITMTDPAPDGQICMEDIPLEEFKELSMLVKTEMGFMEVVKEVDPS